MILTGSSGDGRSRFTITSRFMQTYPRSLLGQLREAAPFYSDKRSPEESEVTDSAEPHPSAHSTMVRASSLSSLWAVRSPPVFPQQTAQAWDLCLGRCPPTTAPKAGDLLQPERFGALPC